MAARQDGWRRDSIVTIASALPPPAMLALILGDGPNLATHQIDGQTAGLVQQSPVCLDRPRLA
jgi:hypothetical protein